MVPHVEHSCSKLLVFCLLWGLSAVGIAESAPPPSNAPNSPAAEGAPSESTAEEKKGTKWVPIPAVYYTPETQLAYGAVLMVIYPTGRPDRPSKVQPHLIYTTRNQLLVGAIWQHFGEDFRFTLNPDFKKFPDNFYGIGPDSDYEDEEIYTPISYETFGAIDYMFTPNCNAGLGLSYERYDIIETDPEGVLQTGTIPGSDRAVVTGVQGRIGYDGRDNTSTPFRGLYVQLNGTHYDKAYGGLSTYDKYTSDLRLYQPLVGSWIFALRLVGEQAVGDVPFRMLPRLGGVQMNRGYYRGRFMDKALASSQASFRFPLYGRFRGNLFYAAGVVADEFQNLGKEKVRHSGGGGLRFYLVPEDRVSLRLDMGFSEDGSGIYFSLNEAY